jgi:hypothetical protein
VFFQRERNRAFGAFQKKQSIWSFFRRNRAFFGKKNRAFWSEIERERERAFF